MSRATRIVAIVGVLVMVLALTASCGESRSKLTHGEPTTPAGVAKPAIGAPTVSGTTSAGSVAEPAVPPVGSGSSDAATAASWDRKIVRNADISLKVSSVESMLATIRSIVDAAGGVVFASSTSYSGENQIATMTLDVPAEQFDQVVNQLRSAPGVKRVEREAVTSQDVTDQYVDLQSQLRNLQATQARLQALMSNATQLQDILTIEQELEKVQAQIEQTTGRINYLDKHTSFSRITVTVTPFGVAVDNAPKPGFDLGNAIHDAWEASLAFTGGILTGLVKATVFLWWFWPIALASALVVLARRQRRKDGNGDSGVVA